MATPGKYRSRAELRKHRRRALSYSAKISTDGNEPAFSCTMSDVSQSGARLILDRDAQIPDRFVLLLADNGGPRRHCQVVWRDATIVGVRFVQV